MHIVGAIAKRELKGYFSTPVAYVVLAVFLFFSSFLTFRTRFFEAGQADLRVFFDMLPILFIFMVPAIGMRLWAEEKKTGTIEVLFSLPVTVAEAVLGKFIAAWTLISVALLLTLPIVFTVNYLGDPDNFVILCGYIGAFLLSGCYLSISIFCSSLTGNQVTAFILSVVLCSLFVFADYPSFLNIFYGLLPVGIIEMIENMSFVVHFESIRRGVVEFGDISFYILIIVCWLACTCIVLDAGKDS